jgi:hypothetical protein
LSESFCRIADFDFPFTLQGSVQNGLLLRADIHNLFDLGLMKIEPDTLLIHLVGELKTTAYAKLDGKKIRVPKKAHERPSPLALAKKKEMLFSGAMLF